MNKNKVLIKKFVSEKKKNQKNAKTTDCQTELSTQAQKILPFISLSEINSIREKYKFVLLTFYALLIIVQLIVDKNFWVHFFIKNGIDNDG